jgi:hypothetical protein
MRGEQLLRAGEYLLGQACRRLPPDIREERYREWAGELPAILHDPQARLAPWRAARMLAYAADTLRGTILTSVKSRRPTPRMAALLYLVLAASLVTSGWNAWTIVRAPEHALNYANMAWSVLLVAWNVSMLVSAPARVTALILISSLLAGVTVNLWTAAQAPADWVSYFLAACLVLLLLAWRLASRWARTKRA